MLRAIAVLLVVAFHVRPTWFPGGYVGVDVFFVISGFLITGSLMAEAHRDGTVKLSAFWGRRVRRLLPAATVVLAFVLVASPFFLPLQTWPTVIQQVAASAVSAENWVLAAQSVDYLQATAPPTPVQHFWSLSVEEQFYLLWPFIILGGLAIARRTTVIPARVMLSTAGGLAVVFLVWSIVETHLSPSTAYFSTATRAWELLAGAVLAIWAPKKVPAPMTSWALIGGVALIAASVVLITPTSPFPGWIALFPVAGAVLIIASGMGAPRWRWLEAAARLRPAVYIGDISYSLYLWHWPIIVFTATFFIKEPRIPLQFAAGAVALSVVAAALSARFIERPFQQPPRKAARWSTRRTLIWGGSLLAVTALFVGGSSLNFQRVESQFRADTDPRHYPGARTLDPAFDPSQWLLAPVAPIPDVEQASHIERQLTPECLTVVESFAITTCEAGDPTASAFILLVGDSHAAQWLPAVDEIGKANHLRVVLSAKQYCTLSAAPRFYSLDNPIADYQECVKWNLAMTKYILDNRPALVIQGSLSYGYPSSITETHEAFDQRMSQNISTAWQPILDAGIPIAAIKEIPRLNTPARACMSLPAATAESCAEPLASLAVATSWLPLAVQQEPRASLIDMTPGICPDGLCESVIGNVYTYRDDSHLSAPYAESLEWMLDAQLRVAEPDLIRS